MDKKRGKKELKITAWKLTVKAKFKFEPLGLRKHLLEVYCRDNTKGDH